jgi:hypothetical protein
MNSKNISMFIIVIIIIVREEDAHQRPPRLNLAREREERILNFSHSAFLMGSHTATERSLRNGAVACVCERLQSRPAFVCHPV